MADDDDLIREAREAFAAAESAESHNRTTYEEDTEFARGGEQWPENILKLRKQENRPALTINKMPAFIRQVVNDARQNKPAIHVHPVDSGADIATAKVLGGLIRNIESMSSADVAYDTGTECAVSGGFGYWRVGLDYAYENGFDMDLCIKRIANPLSVYGDPNSTAADSSDWDTAFVVDRIKEDEFKRKYKGRANTDFGSSAWSSVGDAWHDRGNKTITIAEWWRREQVDKKLLQLSNDMIVKEEQIEKDPDLQVLLASGAVQVLRERVAKCHVVKQHMMSGAEILETRDWMGKFIPIVPVYGDEFDIKGKRYWRSLIHNAVDAQRMYNFWRTMATELTALAPKVPYIGAVGSFATDADRWNSSNSQSHSFLEYDPVPGMPPPQRQPLDFGGAAGALQEALNANDDMKAVMGLYDASLGQRSNETSGKAIMARQREGDVATFHFVDNMARAIRHTGRILIDLIPHVYTTERVIRILGEDGTPESVTVNGPSEQIDPKTGQPMVDEVGQAIIAMHDLRTGQYDITVTTGPSFTTRRQEAAEQITAAIQAFPDAAPTLLPKLAKNLDWPGADEIAKELEEKASGQLPPEVQQQIDEGMQRIQQLEEENQNLKLAQANKENEVASKERIAILEMQSDEKVAMLRADSEMRVAAYKAKLQADASVAAAAMRPAPQAGNNARA